MAEDKQDQLPTDAEIDAELAALLGTEDDPLVPVVMLLPNGAGVIPVQFQATTTTIMQAQALLERGSTTNVADVVTRATAAIDGIVKDADLAGQIAAHLVERDLLK